MQPFTLALADDDYFSRLGLTTLFKRKRTCTLVGQASHVHEAITLVREHNPDLLLVRMTNPLALLQQLRRHNQEVLIVVLTEYLYLAEALEAEGANGFVPIEQIDRLMPTLRYIAQHRISVFHRPVLTEHQARLYQRLQTGMFTPLELEVWKRLRFHYAWLASHLGLSEQRVRNIVSDLYKKLDLDEGPIPQRIQAIDLAQQFGILIHESCQDPGLVVEK